MPGSLWAVASITGSVTAAGQGIKGVSIFVDSLEAQTDNQGRYTIKSAPAGTHTLVVFKGGYRSDSRDVEIPSEGSITVDFSLEPDLLYSDTLVVTGTRNPRTKRESSVAISTLTIEQIAEREPRSTADLLKAIPGFYVESSGGEVGGNLWARGLPADGSYRYVALMEDGMPVYDSTELFFVNADIFVRVDENVEEMEAVRGGNAALFGSNAPGGVINFISRTGTNVPRTYIKLDAGTDGYWRTGFNTSGPIGNDWTYSLGGFYRYDEGVRDPGYPSSQGGQFKFNLTRNFDNGFARAYFKFLDDSNTFFLPLPFNATGNFVRGFPSDGTLHTPEGNQVTVPLPNDQGLLTLPLDDGQRQEGTWLMAEINLELPSGWVLQDIARAMDVDHSWNAVVPFETVPIIELEQELDPGETGELSFTNHEEPFFTVNDQLLLAGLWHVEKPLTSFSNQFQLSKDFTSGTRSHRFAAGAYVSHYEADNVWYFNDILTDVRTQPRFVDVSITDRLGNVTNPTQNGFRRYGSLFVNATGNVDLAALFASDQLQLSQRTSLDIGVRFETNKYRQSEENTTTFDLGDPTTEADDAVTGGTGTFRRVDQTFDEWAFSIGVNRLLSDRTAVWGRASRGYKMPILDNFLFGGANLEAEEIIQFEAGARYGSPKLGVNASAYFLQISDFPSQDARVVDGETVFVTAFVGEAETIGLESELVAEPFGGFRINWGLTYQQPEYTDFIEGEQNFTGNQIRRVPELISDLTVGYHRSRAGISGNWLMIDDRWSNNANTIPLDSYDVVNFRVYYDLSQTTKISLGVVNAFDSEGLTEGNPRLDETAAEQGLLFLARPVLPRRTVLSLEFDL